MKLKSTNCISIFLVITLSLYLSGCATYLKHPDFDKRHKYIKTVSCIKPDVEVYQLTFKGDREIMPELIEPLIDLSEFEVEKIFKEKGYIIKKLDLNKEALEKDTQLKIMLFNIRSIFNKRLEEIAKRRKAKFTYTLGADINDLSILSGSDVLIFVKVSAVKKSGGEIAKDIARTLVVALATLGSVIVYSYPCWCIIQVAVVDGDSGDILWYNHNYGSSQNIDAASPNQVQATIDAVFKPFPKTVTATDKDIKKS